MKLSLFLSGVSVLSSNFDPDSLDATGISTDSRTVRPGELFICLDGTSFDGADYISEASAAGACAVVVRRGRRVRTASVILKSHRRGTAPRRYGTTSVPAPRTA